MSTVIGIFEQQFINNKPLTVVKPGSQTRRFTHIFDTVQVCYEAFKKNLDSYLSQNDKLHLYSIILTISRRRVFNKWGFNRFKTEKKN